VSKAVTTTYGAKIDEIVKYGSKAEILDFSNNNFEFTD
jgi:hypothetical protein